MKIHVKKGNITDFASEAAVVALYEDVKTLDRTVKLLDETYNGAIKKFLEGRDFEGKLFQTFVLYPKNSSSIKRIVLVGLGKKEELSIEKLRGVFATAARQVRALNVKEFSTSLNFKIDKWPLDQTAQAVAEGIFLGLYKFTAFKTIDKDEDSPFKGFTIIDDREDVITIIKASMKIAEIISRAVYFVRDMVSMPANEMTPTEMADKALKIGRMKNVKCKVLNNSDMKKIGMNALLGVARGSKEPAKFIILEYRGGRKSDPCIAVVGKGLTFDSGGICIKPAEGMDEMKSDMAGGAAVLGAVMAASDLQLNVNIIGLIPATENLSGGGAYKPGDILKSLSGQTIEVVNTDAEGRIILADALTYAGRYKPAAIIDLATLTGACVIALGEHVIGMMGTDDELKRKIRHAGEETGERVWELPLWEDYHELIKSDIADYKNTGGRPGGAITAAAFLSKFVDKYPWVHLDIAGPALLKKDKPYIPKGASGVGVRILVQFLRDWAMKQ